MKKNWLWIILFLLFLLVILLQYLKTESVESFHIENHSSNKIPNKIWTFWDGEVPDVVEKCIDSWRKYNPTYSIVVLNKENLSNYLEPQEIEILNQPIFNDSVQRFSDVVRLLILSKYGGFWIDASIICHTSFDWIHEIQEKKQVEIVGYYIDNFTLSDYKIHSPIIENWFFACIPNSPFVKDWCNEFLSIRNHSSIDEYLQQIKEEGINTQKIDSLDYLTMHVSAQKVLQTAPPNKYKLHLFKAEDTAYEYLVKNNWDSNIALEKMMNNEFRHQPILKLRGGERNIFKTMNYQSYFETI